MADGSSPNKGGRPPLPPEKRRTVKMQVYVTERECELLLTLARQNRQDLSDYVRTLCRKSIHQSLRAPESVVVSVPSS